MVSLNEIGTEPEKPKQCPCKCRKGIAVFLIVFLLAGIACWYIHHPNRPRVIERPEINLKPGTMCVVYFRRDALGLSTTASPLVTTVNSTDLTLGGKLVAINSETLLLERINEHYRINDVPQPEWFWIPRSSILHVCFLNLTDK